MNRPIRFRLLTLAVFVLATGAVSGLLGRHYFHQPIYSINHIQVGRIEGMECWRTRRSQTEAAKLEYAVFIPRGVDHSLGMGQSVRQMSPTGVSCIAETLYMNGRRIETSGTSRLFIYTDAQSLVNMKLTEDEFRLVEESGFKKLDQTRLWKEKLLPQIESQVPVGFR